MVRRHWHLLRPPAGPGSSLGTVEEVRRMVVSAAYLSGEPWAPLKVDVALARIMQGQRLIVGVYELWATEKD